MSYTKKIAFNTVAQFAGKIIGIAISLVTVAILFRYLGIEGLGKYTTTFAFVAFAAIFADFGIGWTTLRELSIEKDQNKVFKNTFAFRFFFALFIHSATIAVVWLFPYPNDVRIAVGVLSVAWFFQTMNSTVVSVFIKNYKLVISVAAELVGKLIVLGLIYFVAYKGVGLPTIMGAYLVANAVNFGINLYFARRYVQIGFAYDMKYWRYFIRQAFPIGIVLVFGFIYNKIDSLMLSLMRGMTDVGIYGTPYKLLEVLQTFPALFLGAAFPLVTQYIVKGDERMHSSFQKQFDFLALIAVPVVATVFVLADPIIAFIAGTKGAEFTTASTVNFMGVAMTSVDCMRILVFAVGLSFMSNLYNFTIVSLGKQKQMIWPTLGFAVFNIALNLYLIPRISYIGASLATLATEVIIFATVYHIVNRTIKFKITLLPFLKIVISGVACGFFAYWLNSAGVNFFVTGALALVLYSLIVILFNAVPLDLVKAALGASNENRD